MTDTVKIKVVGVGGAGINTVNRMIKNGLTSVEFLVINADEDLLAASDCEYKIQLGIKTLNGFAAGGDRFLGEKAAKESEPDIRNAIEGADMVFITAGMGGGTGTGAAPVIAKIAKDMGILTVAVVLEPFSFEGQKRHKQAQTGIKELKEGASPNSITCSTASLTRPFSSA